MKVRFWGTRGSVPSPGPGTVRYGGNTPCLEVQACPGSLVVLDAGTGIRSLGAAIGGDIERVDILLTHFHLDHVQGLAFFAPFFWPRFDVHVWGPRSRQHDLAERLSRLLSPPLSPVRLGDFLCHLSLHDVEGEGFALPGLDAAADLVSHPGRTFGFRLTGAAGSMAYVPDHELALERRRDSSTPSLASAHDLVAGVDVLIHDAQYASSESPAHVGWGHSSMTEAIAFASDAKVGRLRAFHHDPEHDDDTIDRLVADAVRSCGCALDVAAAAEGEVVELSRSSARI